MSLFAIADLHLSFGVSKPMDVFKGWDNYVEKLEKKWRTVVKTEDTVVISGDISWAMDLNEALEDFRFIDKLPGKKIIIKGNHDYWWTTRNKIEKFLKENSFESIKVLFNSAETVEDVCICGTRGWLDTRKMEENEKLKKREALRLKTSIECAEKNKEIIVFLHYPPVYCDNRCEEIMEVLKEKKIKRCFYGHVHGKEAHAKALNGKYMGVNFKLVSCDYLKFVPYKVF